MRQRLPHHFPEGYAALVSVLLISFILLGLTASVSATTFYARFNVLDEENKRLSQFLAESCIYQTFLYITEQYNYEPPASGETVRV